MRSLINLADSDSAELCKAGVNIAKALQRPGNQTVFPNRLKAVIDHVAQNFPTLFQKNQSERFARVTQQNQKMLKLISQSQNQDVKLCAETTKDFLLLMTEFTAVLRKGAKKLLLDREDMLSKKVAEYNKLKSDGILVEKKSEEIRQAVSFLASFSNLNEAKEKIIRVFVRGEQSPLAQFFKFNRQLITSQHIQLETQFNQFLSRLSSLLKLPKILWVFTIRSWVFPAGVLKPWLKQCQVYFQMEHLCLGSLAEKYFLRLKD